MGFVEFPLGPSGSMIPIASGTLSGASVTVSNIGGSYTNLLVQVVGFKPANDGTGFYLRFNSDTGTNYFTSTTITGSSRTPNATSITAVGGNDNTNAQGLIDVYIPRYSNITSWKITQNFAIANNNTTNTNADTEFSVGWWKSTSAITSITMIPGSGNFTSGDYYIYGIS